jgi:hypothetical protein
MGPVFAGLALSHFHGKGKRKREMPVKDNRAPTTRKVLDYYRNRPGEIIFYGDAADDLGLARNRVNAAINRVAKTYPEMGFRRSGMAGHYVFLSDAPGAEKPHGAVITEVTYPEWQEASKQEIYPTEDYYNKDVPAEDAPKIPARSSLDGIGETYTAIYRQKSNGRMIVRDSGGDLFYLTEM